MSILITGGAGYIGSHTCVELLNAGKDIIIVDNFSNSSPDVIKKIEEITNKNIKYYKIDILDRNSLETVFTENNIDSVIHFAGYKAVGESVGEPLKYYYNNVTSTIVLSETMSKYNVKNIVFSSSATVYGSENISPLTESMPLGEATNPYGTSKLMNEQILKDLYISDKQWKVAILRYFNPIGAHKSGKIGESPRGTPNNLMPYITQVANKRLEKLNIFGDDYDTHDGTGVRDYIHVVDLAKGHLKALNKLETSGSGLYIYNLGTGRGYSVLDLVKAFEKSTGERIPFTIVDRRPGDIGVAYADPSKAYRELGWRAQYTLEDMCRDSWNWEKGNN